MTAKVVSSSSSAQRKKVVRESLVSGWTAFTLLNRVEEERRDQQPAAPERIIWGVKIQI